MFQFVSEHKFWKCFEKYFGTFREWACYVCACGCVCL